MNLDQLDVPLSQFATLIFVIDIQVGAIMISVSSYSCKKQDSYQPSILKLVTMFIAAYNESSRINLEVFVHKADTLSEEYRMGACCRSAPILFCSKR